MEDFFKDCTNKSEIMRAIIIGNEKTSSWFVNQEAAKKFLELGMVDEAERFYLLSQQQKNE